MGGTLFWVLIIRILLFRVQYQGPPFSEPSIGTLQSAEHKIEVQPFAFKTLFLVAPCRTLDGRETLDSEHPKLGLKRLRACPRILKSYSAYPPEPLRLTMWVIL